MRKQLLAILALSTIAWFGLAGCSPDVDEKPASTPTQSVGDGAIEAQGGRGGGSGCHWGGGGGRHHQGGGRHHGGRRRHGGNGHGGGGQHGNGNCDGGDSGGGETAFGYSCDEATCFRVLDLNGDGCRDFSRWGWTNGPLGPGSYTFDLYAGAGQCDLTKGTLVGQILVTYEGSTVTVEYVLCGNYGLSEVHTYVGNKIVPKKSNGQWTVAPGQFPYGTGNLGGDQYHDVVFENVSGQVYVIAHAVITGSLRNGDCGQRGCVEPCVPGFFPTALELFLPTTPVTATWQFQGNTGLTGPDDAYALTNLAGAGALESPAGVYDYPTWCVDGNHSLGHSANNIQLISSYSTNAALLGCLVDRPENLDLVNWIINQDPAIWGAEQRDIQAAIWSLVETNFAYCGTEICTKGGVTYRKSVAQAIEAAARANGEGFYPPCDGVIAVLLDNGCLLGTGITRQVTIIEVPVVEVPGLCEDCE